MESPLSLSSGGISTPIGGLPPRSVTMIGGSSTPNFVAAPTRTVERSNSKPNNIINTGSWFDGLPSVGLNRSSSAGKNATSLAHPCQSGRPCECGGTCKKEKSTINAPLKEERNPRRAKNSAALERAQHMVSQVPKEDYERFVLRTTENSISAASISLPNGKNILISARIVSDNSISILAHDNSSQEPSFAVRLPFDPKRNGWSLAEKPEYLIPKTTSLDVITMYVGGLLIANEFIRAKRVQKDSAGDTTYNHNRQSPLATTEYPCVSHDLRCSPLVPWAEVWPWTSDQQHVKFWLLGIGDFTVEVGECCKKHDVSIWCAHDLLGIDGADEVVIGCILAQVRDAALDELNRKIADENVFSAAFDILFTMPALLIQIAALYYYIYPIMSTIYFLVFHGMNTLGLLDWDLTNFSHDHDNSCLCGGTEPTTGCNDRCRDLCKEFPEARSKEQGCFDCYFQCEYLNGIPIGKKFIEGSVDSSGNKTPCCPGTGQYASSPSGLKYTDSKGNPIECEQYKVNQQAACPTCADCDWSCEKSADGTWSWGHPPTENGLPCCTGAPTDRFCGCEWECNENFEASGGYEVKLLNLPYEYREMYERGENPCANEPPLHMPPCY